MATIKRNPEFKDHIVSTRFAGWELRLMEEFYHKTGMERSKLIRESVIKYIHEHQE